MAALTTPDESVLSGLHLLDRGYEHLITKLQTIGANIERKQAVQSTSTLFAHR